MGSHALASSLEERKISIGMAVGEKRCQLEERAVSDGPVLRVAGLPGHQHHGSRDVQTHSTSPPSLSPCNCFPVVSATSPQAMKCPSRSGGATGQRLALEQ